MLGLVFYYCGIEIDGYLDEQFVGVVYEDWMRFSFCFSDDGDQLVEISFRVEGSWRVYIGFDDRYFSVWVENWRGQGVVFKVYGVESTSSLLCGNFCQ